MARSTRQQQKRKRDDLATLDKSFIVNEEQDDAAADELPPTKKAKESMKKLEHKADYALNGKKDEKMEVDVSVEKIDVWIGATNANKVGLYYGTAADERNWTGVPELEPESRSLEDACVWAAIQAIDRCGSEVKPVFIYTDCGALCTSGKTPFLFPVSVQKKKTKERTALKRDELSADENRNPLREKLNEKIKQRSGTTVILHTLATTSSQLQEAQELVVVKQLQRNETTTVDDKEERKNEKQIAKMAVSNNDASVPVQESNERLEKDTVLLKVSEAKVAHTQETMVQQSNDAAAAADGDDGKDASADGPTPAAAAAWKPTGGLARNLLDILMSPFVRKTRTR
ncbi:hypothetical protein BDB00DRAFT_941121 [Zychaea mexicana]|uniref:uncharacterized protein n=1 Tax=Zychaea mexicana TaxID=64656 RepID=UPI0022FE2146|nr:uncharacterized protein BDB00DRAFT_941121 [Zychaea mexicana]KAI9490226.1 hypothetical protein BDB00DRAFT_941121 [Zychaea mexicana]